MYTNRHYLKIDVKQRKAKLLGRKKSVCIENNVVSYEKVNV